MGFLDWDGLQKLWAKIKTHVQTSLEGYAKKTDLSTVATSGSYNDLTDKPEGGSAEIGDTIEVKKIAFPDSTGTHSASLLRAKDDGRLELTGSEGVYIAGGHGGDILLDDEAAHIEGDGEVTIKTYYGGDNTKISVTDDGQDTGLVAIRGRKNVSIRSEGALHIGIGDSYGSVINFYDDGFGIEIDTNNLCLGKVSQIYASSSKGSSDASSGEAGQVLISTGDGELYWGDAPSGGTGGGSPLYNHSYTVYAPELDTSECEIMPRLEFISSKDTLCETLDEIAVALRNGEITFIRGQGQCQATEVFYTVSYISPCGSDESWWLQFTLSPYGGGNSIVVNCESSDYYILVGNSKVIQITEGVGGSSSNSGGAGLSMPRIRVNGWRYEEIPVGNDVGGKVEFTSGKIIFSVNVQDGTVQEGDELQVCAVRNVFGRKKLRPILSKTITAEDLENLTKQPFLQISTDDISGNNLAQTSNKAIKSFYHTDSKDFRKPKPKYVRVRRPIYDEDGQEVNAIFSNVVPVEILLRFFEQV